MDKKLFQQMHEQMKPKKEVIKALKIELEKTQREERKTMKYFNKKKLILLSAVIFIFMIGIGVTAMAVNSMDRQSSTLYSWSVKEGVQHPNIFDTDAGYTITANSVFGDEYNTYILFTIAKEDGTAIQMKLEDGKADIGFHEYAYEFEGEKQFKSCSAFVLAQKEGEEGIYQYGLKLSTNGEFNVIGKTVHITLEGLSADVLHNLKNSITNNWGKWEFDIPLEYENAGIEYDFYEPFIYKGKEAFLEKLHYSPLDVSIYLKSEEEQYALADFILDSCFDGKIPFYLLMTDGTCVYSSSSTGDNIGTHASADFDMTKIGPIKKEDIEAIVIGDEIIPIDLE